MQQMPNIGNSVTAAEEYCIFYIDVHSETQFMFTFFFPLLIWLATHALVRKLLLWGRPRQREAETPVIKFNDVKTKHCIYRAGEQVSWAKKHVGKTYALLLSNPIDIVTGTALVSKLNGTQLRRLSSIS